MCVDFDLRKTTENVMFDLNIVESKEDLVCGQNSSLFSWVKGFARALRGQRQQHMTEVPSYTLYVTKELKEQLTNAP